MRPQQGGDGQPDTRFELVDFRGSFRYSAFERALPVSGCHASTVAMEKLSWLQILGWLPFQIFLCLLISTTHLRKTNGKIAKGLSSVFLLLLIPFILDWHSNHLCDQGDAPPFIKYGLGLLGASLPWVLSTRPWITRIVIIPILLIGVLVAQYLTASYHKDDITGNPYYSKGRFWHTPFTGQYVRESKEAAAAREVEIQRLRAM